MELHILESIHSIIYANPKKVVELYVNENLIESKIDEEKKIAEQEFSKLLSDFENKKITGDLLAQILQKKAKESSDLEKQLAAFSKYTTNEATAKAIAEIQSYKDIVDVHHNYQEDVLEYNDLVENKYQTALNRLESAKTSFEINKSAYEELKDYNSYEELLD